MSAKKNLGIMSHRTTRKKITPITRNNCTPRNSTEFSASKSDINRNPILLNALAPNYTKKNVVSKPRTSSITKIVHPRKSGEFP